MPIKSYCSVGILLKCRRLRSTSPPVSSGQSPSSLPLHFAFAGLVQGSAHTSISLTGLPPRGLAEGWYLVRVQTKERKNGKRAALGRRRWTSFSHSLIKFTTLLQMSLSEKSNPCQRCTFLQRNCFPLPVERQRQCTLISRFFVFLTQQKNPKQKEETDIFWIDRCQGTLPSHFLID